MKVLLAGGTGFIGRHCAEALAAAGHEVVAVSRTSARWRADLSAPIEAPAKLEVGAIVNVVGIARQRGSNTFDRAHVDVPRRLVEWARQQGVRRFVHISVVDVAAPPRNGAEAYRRTKRAGEAVVRESGLDWTILRPGLVYGAGDDLMTRIIRLVRLSPWFPVSKQGGPLQLIDVRDVAAAVVATLERPLAGETIDLVGPERTSLAELTVRVARAQGLSLRPIALPASWMRIAVRAPGAPLSPTQLGMLEAGLFGDSAQATTHLGLQPRALGDAQIVELARELSETVPARWLRALLITWPIVAVLMLLGLLVMRCAP